MNKKTSVKQKSEMIFFRWTSRKPKFDSECIVICGNRWKNEAWDKEEWEYTLYLIKRVECEERWYWGWLTADGEEYDDLRDMKADIYFVMPLVVGNKKQFNK